MRIIVEGPQGSGKSTFIHHVLIDALRRAGRGARFYDGESGEPNMTLTGNDYIDVYEKQTDI